MLYVVYEELPSFREIDRAFMDPLLCTELHLGSVCHSSLSRKISQIHSDVLMDIFIQLVQKISTQKPGSKTSMLQLSDSPTIPLNKMWLP